MDRVPGFEPGGWRFEPSSVQLFSMITNKNLSILSLTQEAYSQAIFDKFGKGRIHAGLVYEEWFRTGAVQGKSPAFKNAQTLLQEIQELTNFSLPEVVNNHYEGIVEKFLVRTHDQLEVEAVWIPMQAGGTLCISSQVGCRMGCAFCETGRMGLLRNLTAEEIVSQVFIARFQLNLSFRNIVFMGMGEPFDNYDAVMQAVRVLMDPKGLGFGRNRITISTSGCIEGIYQLIKEGEKGPNLAISVNAPEDKLRTRLMPVNRKHSLAQLYEAMDAYCSKTGRQILAAYVLMQGVNDSIEHADQLAEYLKGLNVKINLIPYNPQSSDRFQPPDSETIDLFRLRLQGHGYRALLRLTKGKNIMAACGQLGNLSLRRQRKDSSSCS